MSNFMPANWSVGHKIRYSAIYSIQFTLQNAYIESYQILSNVDQNFIYFEQCVFCREKYDPKSVVLFQRKYMIRKVHTLMILIIRSYSKFSWLSDGIGHFLRLSSTY